MHYAVEEGSAMARALQSYLGQPSEEERRLRVRLSRISDFETLAALLFKAPSDSCEGELTEARIAEVLSEILPHLFRFRVLADMLLKISHESRPEQLIEARARAVLRSEYDYDVLVRMCQETSNLHIRQLVRERIREVLPKILPDISDFNILADMLRKAPSDSHARQRIKSRMAELIEDVSLHTVQQQTWFFDLLFKRTELPRACQVVFKEKVRELLRQLDAA